MLRDQFKGLAMTHSSMRLLLSILVVVAVGASSPVEVLVCTEALCPDCEHFVADHLVSVYEELGPEVMNLKLVPYGNAKLLANGTAVCQHGVGECDANIYELCAISLHPDPDKYLPFVQCLAENLPMGHADKPLDQKLFQDCATNSAGLWWSRILACHDIPKVATKMVQNAAAATPSDHTYVPWIEIEGDHMDEEKQDFKEEICKAFVAKGGSDPKCDGVV